MSKDAALAIAEPRISDADQHRVYGDLSEIKIVSSEGSDLDRPPPDHWPEWLKAEYAENRENLRVGQTLVSEVAGTRVWHIALNPGERLPLHRHNRDYLWTAISDGRGLSHDWNGVVVETAYRTGMTKHYRFENGGSYFHDLENIGPTPLRFVVVEFDSRKRI